MKDHGNNPTISFYGGVGDVTGANFVLRHGGLAVMVDCGMFQGSEEDIKRNYEPFGYMPNDIDVLLVTHAHADHIGRIPKLVRDGFRGVIYSTEPTRQLTEIMFQDSLYHVERYAKDHDLSQPLYDAQDVARTFEQWQSLPYHEPTELHPECSFEFFDAGHILGSAMVVMSCGGKKIGFTGDLGNSPAPLLPDTELLEGLDYLVMESVYGDRNHEERDLRSSKFCDALIDTIERDGTVLIPAFSLERTQEILSEINTLVEGGTMPRVPVYLDSPLAIRVTEVYRNATAYFNTKTQATIASGDDIFDFPGLQMTPDKQDSKDIFDVEGSKIIVAGSGMSTGGRIVHHEKKYLQDPRNTLVFVGYQAAGTLGRKLQDGVPEVFIHGQKVRVAAQVLTITGYSGHKQRDDMLAFVAHTAGSLTKVWCVMGEYQSSAFLAQRLRDYVGVIASVPQPGETVILK